jgi:hypothetical protein
MPTMRSRSALSLVALLLVAAFTWAWLRGGALQSDLGGDSDEPAHAVTSLMVRDYLAGITTHAPMAFARAYYADFPKVAIGHFPPLYYLVGGAALLAWPHRDTLLMIQWVLGLLVGVMTYVLARRAVGPVQALAAAVVASALPVMLRISHLVMSDTLLVVLCLAALLAWLHFEERPSTARALAFGVVAALAILTKGSGLLLGAVPPGAAILQRDFGKLRQARWWAALVPVLVLALPWMVLAVSIHREAMVGSPLRFLTVAIPFYARVIPDAWGWLLTTLALVALAGLLVRAWRGPLSPVEAVLVSAFAGGLAILVLIPVRPIPRYLAPLTPIMAILAVLGAEQVARRLSARAATVAMLLVAVGFVSAAGLPKKEVHGFTQAVEFVLSQETLPGPPEQDRWLVGSDPRGEGAVIAETAFRLPRRSPSPVRIYRSSKELSSSDWMGRGYRLEFSTEADVLAHLEDIRIHWVLVDRSVPADRLTPDQVLLERTMKGVPQHWRLVRTQPVTREPGVTGELLVYRAQR